MRKSSVPNIPVIIRSTNVYLPSVCNCPMLRFSPDS
jgi:hypothetical protein